MQLVATGLSKPGYVTATTIMGLENVLDHVENWQVDWGRQRGRDPQLYWLRVFGEPDLHGPWSWRFGGHHVSVQHLVLDGEVGASSPCFLGWFRAANACPTTNPTTKNATMARREPSPVSGHSAGAAIVSTAIAATGISTMASVAAGLAIRSATRGDTAPIAMPPANGASTDVAITSAIPAGATSTDRPYTTPTRYAASGTVATDSTASSTIRPTAYGM